MERGLRLYFVRGVVGFLLMLLGTASLAGAESVTTRTSLTGKRHEIDFHQFTATTALSSGAVQIGGAIGADVTARAENVETALRNDKWDLGDNGVWSDSDTRRMHGYIGIPLDKADVVRIDFNGEAVLGVGGFMNHHSSAREVSLKAYDADGDLLESFDILRDAPISTPASENGGGFRGILRQRKEIARVEIAGAGIAFDELTYITGEAEADPEPGTIPNEAGALTKTQVSSLYVTLFGRASEGEGNSFWRQTPFKADMVATANIMLENDAAKAYFGDKLDDDREFVEHIYQGTLGKSVDQDPDGIAYWTGRLQAGDSKGQVVAALITAAGATENAGPAQDRFNNKVAVSDYCADTLARFTGDIATFTNFVDDVTDAESTVSFAKALINGNVDNGHGGGTGNRLLKLGVEYRAPDGLTVVLNAMKIVEIGDTYEYTIEYALTNHTPDKIIDEGVFKFFYRDKNGGVPHIGFANSLSPGQTQRRTHAVVVFRHEHLNILEYHSNNFSNPKPSEQSLKWDASVL